jgi:NAD(P)-dependent dehydrogenase (short-subunit alcohol dehydrogenase family)
LIHPAVLLSIELLGFMQMYDYSDQVMLVTGGSGNLGQAVIKAFRLAGGSVIAVDHTSDRLNNLFPALADSPDAYLAGGIDVTDPEAVEALLEDSLQRFGKIDILVNTVGGYQAGKPVHETSLKTWDYMMDLNARSAFIVSRAVLPGMLSQGRGKIINIAASLALKSSANNAAYSAAKSAVARLTESMADEYKRQGINVNAVLPGTIDTPQNREAMPKADFSLWVTPEALARVIMFLASEDASPIHGALLPVYGKR